MSEYVDRDRAIAEIHQMVVDHRNDQFNGVLLHYTGVIAALSCLPAADVRPVTECTKCREETEKEIEDIKKAFSAKYRPVVRGRWKLDSDPGEPWRYVCNICGEKTKDTVMGKPRANFCPNCGADMRGESDV